MKQTIGRTMLPYCIRRHHELDKTWVVLNRNYSPIGISQTYMPGTNSDDIQGHIRCNFSSKFLNKFGYDSDENHIYLYNDSTAPWLSKKNMSIYMEYLSLLVKIECLDRDRTWRESSTWIKA